MKIKIRMREGTSEDGLNHREFRFYELEGIPQLFPEIPGLTSRACIHIAEKVTTDLLVFPQYVDGQWSEVAYERKPEGYHFEDYDGLHAIVSYAPWRARDERRAEGE